MRFTLVVPALLALMGSACGSTAPDRLTTWGSDQASLTLAEDKATVQVLASGRCYGSYGSIDHAVLSAAFTLSGTYTQLIGAYPGRIQYAAEYTGTIAGSVMTLNISVPALQQTIGPFHLKAGVTSAWTACLYP